MLRKARKGLESRNSRRVRMKASPRKRSHPNYSRTWGRPGFWHSKTGSGAWHRTRSLRVSGPMRGTVPPTTRAGRRPCRHWRLTHRDPAVVLTSVRLTAASEAEAEEGALAAVGPEAALR